ncbi:hypothetical protein TNCV_5062861 [Trichonephila clavipes]|nr:hypothetical protein TNCV_5062861 [Trichonephila clavipes]
MASSEQKAFCVFQFAKIETAITVQRAFRIQFGHQPSNDNIIRRWHHPFQTTGYLYKRKSSGEIVARLFHAQTKEISSAR